MIQHHIDIVEFYNLIPCLGRKVSECDCQYVYGVPRGGVPVAMALAEHTGRILIDDLDRHPDRKVLVVDDIVDSGDTRKRYDGYPFACLHFKNRGSSQSRPDYFCAEVPRDEWIVYWWEKDGPGSIRDNVLRQLQFIGEDPLREGLQSTPDRVVRSWLELYSGYGKNPADILTVFDADGCDQMVVLRNIEFYSTCEHHMLPFIGKAHVAYLPDEKIIGISKLARLFDIYARRLQVQERIGEQVTAALMEHLKPLGAACVIEAHHLCMRMRGVEKEHPDMVTSSLKGVFRDESGTAKAELLQLIRS